MKPCDERENILERLDAFIEFAEKTHRFHDADFYKHCKKEIINLTDRVEFLEDELHSWTDD